MIDNLEDELEYVEENLMTLQLKGTDTDLDELYNYLAIIIDKHYPNVELEEV